MPLNINLLELCICMFLTQQHVYVYVSKNDTSERVFV